MRTYLDCLPCLLRQSLEAARSVSDDERMHEKVIRETLRLSSEIDFRQPPPGIAKLVHAKLRETTGVEDPYKAVKEYFNRLALELLPELREKVTRAEQPLLAAVKAAIAANVIDLGVKSSLSEEQALEVLRSSGETPITGDYEGFTKEAEKAEDILYLADNAGEIVIDRLLIEELGPRRVTLAVRGKPVINDATMEDARVAGMHEIVKIIDNGSDAPGTLLDDCSAGFRERFRSAGLVIAKGQGNYETLSGSDNRIFFLLKVKCPVIARHCGLPVGSHAVLRNEMWSPDG